MTTIQRLPLLSRLGSAPVLPAGPPGSGPGHPGGATQRGRWRFRVTGPASLALAGAVVTQAAVPPAAVPQAAAAPRTAGHRAAGTSVARVRGLAP
jgi:hypothetical protein